MKVKRLKRASRVLTFFRYKFGYISPYSILLDGTFCQEALKCKINLREQLPKYLRDENLEMFVTECVLNELGIIFVFLISKGLNFLKLIF